MKINANLYPNGKKYALTMSYDDGSEHDRRLIEIFNRYQIKGTFHLNAGNLNSLGYLTTKEIPELFQGHEVSCHAYSHPFLQQLPTESVLDEIRMDRQVLEQACGYIMRGMSYPFGTYNQRVIDMIEMSGMAYSRTVHGTNRFELPEDFLEWHPTAHHKEDLKELFRKMVNSNYPMMQLLYIWGHSFEFEKYKNWHIIEEFCKLAAHHEDIWYATNIEIYDYIQALKSLKYSIDCRMVYNPSCLSVWIMADHTPIEIKPGKNDL